MVYANNRMGGLCVGLALTCASIVQAAPITDDQDKAKPAATQSAAGQPAGPARPISMRRAEPRNDACGEIAVAAKTFGLPENFLVQLLWRESRFNPRAVSSAGAIGIAQFMPGTAQWRGLDDPFNWSLSIQHSGRWLGELRQKFGNLGLAAAAYNAGPARVQDWLAGVRALPQETRNYVRNITGRDADDWVGMRDAEDEPNKTRKAECPPQGAIAALSAAPNKEAPVASAKSQVAAMPKRSSRPWSLQLTGDRSRSTALLQFVEMRRQFPTILGPHEPEVVPRRIGGRAPTYWYQVRVSEVSRQSATTLCERLKSAGGQCLIIRN
ncbi:hypothetical protein CCR94_22180 [Rhodoblastus sphagnicola]|uniref:Transglycosylase SLT domain-containing protein n=1 Tax=Rhodoblastus sphagnicola TaxID=333368 RepID=A0A2S6MVG8_9HYPH|nr:transglycosylase SLT domain-containing protein [Rhodoblastus sphagnicola]MBB4197555.1 hypothetical protein [Rhodoblastus sphagnicola]PPQ26356.1 hypothetical protein CCR94_22180 [Rhodoblastus sphagnicola]